MKLTGIFLLFLIFKSFPTIFKEENAYKVSATTAINAKDLPNIRYGLQGKTVTIIGKKTYFNYFLDKSMGRTS